MRIRLVDPNSQASDQASQKWLAEFYSKITLSYPDVSSVKGGEDLVLSLGPLAALAQTSVTFVLCFDEPLTCTLQVLVEGSTSGAISDGVPVYMVTKEYSESLDCVVPFEVSFHLETLDHVKIDILKDRLAPGDRFLLAPEVRSLVPWSMEVRSDLRRLRDGDDSPIAPYPRSSNNEPLTSSLYPHIVCGLVDTSTELASGEVLSQCLFMRLPDDGYASGSRPASHIPLGLFALHWRRISAQASIYS